MRRLTVLALIMFCLAFWLCGCEAFRKKFVRKPKSEKEIRAVTQTQEYLSEYSQEQIYKKYFSFWRGAHQELMDALGTPEGNRKRRLFYAEKIVEYLEQMRQLLLPEKQAILDDLILEQERVIKKLDTLRLNRAQWMSIKSRLEKQRSQVQKEFSYQNIQEYLRK